MKFTQIHTYEAKISKIINIGHFNLKYHASSTKKIE